MPYKVTELRRDIFRVLDKVLETGEVVEVERKGRLLRIVPVDAPAPIERLRQIPDLIVGDPGALEHVDWAGEWKP